MAPTGHTDGTGQTGGLCQSGRWQTANAQQKTPPKLKLKEMKNLHKTKQNTLKPARN
jgi:hypothetical protein